MRLRERLFRRGPRCPFCRDPLRDAAAAPPCVGCGVQLHADCAGELGRCPTIACPSAQVGLAVSVDEEESADGRRVVPTFDGPDSPRAVAITFGVIVAALALATAYEPDLWPFSLGIALSLRGLVGLAALLSRVLDWLSPTLAARVRVRPARPHQAVGLRITVDWTPGMARALSARPTAVVDAALVCTRGSEVLWRGLRVARQLSGVDRARFDFDPPARLAKETGVEWRVHLGSDARPWWTVREVFSFDVAIG
jgi:hypothetical protein